MRNLAPHIKRQRLVSEGKRNGHISSEQIVDYLLRLSDLLKMHTIGEVVTSFSPDEGWADGYTGRRLVESLWRGMRRIV